MSIDTIDDALDRVAEEKRTLQSEKQGVLAFKDEVKSLPITPPAPRNVKRSGAGLGDVLGVYRQTMESDGCLNGEGLEASFREEFTAELLAELREESVTGRSKRRLLEAIERARDRRTKHLAVIEGEEKSLEAVHSELADIDGRLECLPHCSVTECSLEKMVDVWETLDHLEQRCNEVLASRQSFLQGISDSELDAPIPPEALYDAYPALRAIAARTERIYAKRDGASSVDSPTARDGTRPTREVKTDDATSEELDGQRQEPLI
jgi:hypothetical protein